MMSNHKTALVTGGARRIGAALVTALHDQGYRVMIHYRHSAAEAHALAEKCCAKRPGSAFAISANLDETADIDRLIQKIVDVGQRLDVVINNASQYFPTPIGKTTEQQWLDLTKSNLMAPFFIAQAAFPLLQATQGCVINLTDTNVTHPKLNYSVYISAKAGLNTLTHALALEFAPHVRVNGIAIGTTLPPEGINQAFATQLDQAIEAIPLQRLPTLTEITQTALFLIDNQFMTGQIVTVDGGKSL
jgi:pteridine reductase